MCLCFAFTCKGYIAVFLIFLLRQRKWMCLAVAAATSTIATAISICCFTGTPVQIVNEYLYAQTHIAQVGVYGDSYLVASASLWSTYKIALIEAECLGIIPPVTFDWNGHLIRTSYAIYCIGTFGLATILAGYAAFIEKEFHRCAILFLIFASAAVPTGTDYRMLYCCIALALLVGIKTRRPGDGIAAAFLAFVLIPKAIVFFSFAAYPNTKDISIQVVLNPLASFTAMGILLYDGFRNYDKRWTRLRIRRLFDHSFMLKRVGLLPPKRTLPDMGTT
jgi:hypothetical protein